MSYQEVAPIKTPSIVYDQDKQKFIIKRRRKAKYKRTQQPTVDITHLQKWIKKVRKTNQAKNIKYYGVSEYGTKSKRPHYHVILLGADIISLVGEKNWQLFLEGKAKLNGEMQLKIDSWKFGHVTIGTCTPASVSYTLKYISKGRQIPQFKGDKRQKERSIMSKGIGACYLSPKTIKLHRNDLDRQYVVTHDSKKIPIPRYLKDRLYDSLEREYMVKVYAARYLQEILEMGDKELRKHEILKRKNVDSLDTRKIRIGKTDKL